MIKKILLLFFLSIILIGCVNHQSQSSENTETDPIVYETTMSFNTLKSVNIYDTIYLNSFANLNDFQFKSSVFDLEKVISLNWSTMMVRSSNSAMNGNHSADQKHYTFNQTFTYINSRTHVNAYAVADFSSYLDSNFFEDIQKLEHNEITADHIFLQYGTHVVMSVRLSYHINLKLSIESNDLNISEYEYIKDILFNSRPLSFPISDESFLAYQAKSRITFEVLTTHTALNIEDILNDYNTSTFPLTNLFDKEDIIPIYSLFGWNNTLYPNAINKLIARYNELYLLS